MDTLSTIAVGTIANAPGLLSIRERQPPRQQAERSRERPAQPDHDAGTRDDSIAHRRREQAVYDEDDERDQHENAA